MTIQDLLKRERALWGTQRLTLSQIIVRMGVLIGDLCRLERGAKKDTSSEADRECMKELGNIIASTVRWCDDLGYDPEECIALALTCQEQYVKERQEG